MSVEEARFELVNVVGIGAEYDRPIEQSQSAQEAIDRLILEVQAELDCTNPMWIACGYNGDGWMDGDCAELDNKRRLPKDGLTRFWREACTSCKARAKLAE